MTRHAATRLAAGTATALLAVIAVVGVADRTAAGSDDSAGVEPVFIELRVWQHVDEWRELWVSARPRGGSWRELGTVPLVFEPRTTNAFFPEGRRRYADVEVGGVGFRVWQQWWFHSRLPAGVEEPRSVHVEACAGPCEPLTQVRLPAWGPLGMTPLALEDGPSRSGLYRYGDLTVAIPKDNPGLLADREHLLALRDVLAGDGRQLDWSVGTAAGDWEGVTVGGSPPRVAGLDLGDRGLAGEIWGWLGDLSALSELRLNGNALTGRVPSKLSLLRNLTDVRLAGNDLEGCLPPSLRRAADYDLDALGLPDCPAPEWGLELTRRVTPEPYAVAGTYWLNVRSGPPFLVFDIPAGESMRLTPVQADSYRCYSEDHGGALLESAGFDCHFPNTALVLNEGESHYWRQHGFDGAWLAVEFSDYRQGAVLDRSHCSGCVYDCGGIKSPAAFVEQLAASVWVNREGLPGYYATEPEDWWVWP